MIDTTGKCSACGQTVGIGTIHTCSPQVTAPTPERRVVERLTCSCPDWASGTEAINGPIIEKAVRSGLTWQFTGKKFRFCPWCGKALAPPAPEATE